MHSGAGALGRVDTNKTIARVEPGGLASCQVHPHITDGFGHDCSKEIVLDCHQASSSKLTNKEAKTATTELFEKVIEEARDSITENVDEEVAGDANLESDNEVVVLSDVAHNNLELVQNDKGALSVNHEKKNK